MANLRTHLTTALAITTLALGFTGCGEDPVETDPPAADMAGGTGGGAADGSTGAVDMGMGGTGGGGADMMMGGSGGAVEADMDVVDMMPMPPAGDTEPLPEVGGDWSPSSRITYLDLPADAAAGTEAGCDLQAAGQGSGLAGLLALVGGNGLADFVTPDDNGDIQLILLGHFADWAVGKTGNEVGTTTLNLYTGKAQGDGFFIDPASFIDGDVANGSVINFPNTAVADSAIVTEEGDFVLSIPNDALPLSLRLAGSRLNSSLRIEQDGFSAQNGIIGGYFTKDSIFELINGILAFCGIPENANGSLCGGLAQFTGGSEDPQAIYDLLINLGLIALDSKYENGAASLCAGDECNAVGVCLMFEMTAQKISGIAAP